MQRLMTLAAAVALLGAGLVGGAVLRPTASQAQPAPARPAAAAPRPAQCTISAASDSVAWILCGERVARCVYDGHQTACG